MAFTTRKRVAQSVQGEVTQAYVLEELDAVVDFRQDALGDGGIVLIQLQVAEELLQVVDRQVHQLGDGASAYLYIAGFLLQTGAVAGRTIGFPPIACQHHAVLNLILVLLQHLEEGVDASLFSRAVPQIVLLLLSKLIVRSEDGEVVSRGFVQEFL